MKRFAVVAILALITVAMTQANKCDKDAVVSVGRCDSHGSCEVTFADKTPSYAYRPTIGEQACRQ